MDKYTVLKKMLHYCNYQDRCEKEIRAKLNSFELEEDDKSFVFDFLYEEGFVDDERYCRQYVKGKLNVKKWGVNKIKVSLLSKGIEKSVVEGVLADIDKEQYRGELANLLRNKKIDEPDLYKRKAKLMRFALSRGYSMSEIMDVIDKI